MSQLSLFDDIYTVSQVTTEIRSILENSASLKDIWISGEVSNMTRASSGHWYFTVKDDKASLKCVMWRSTAVRQSFTPNNGDAIEVRGSITVYEPRGEYQLVAERVRPVGRGSLFEQFEELKAKLDAEGLFAQEHKKPIPAFPHRIGVVSSPTTAAFQDVLNVLTRRFPLAEVILSPTLVQGNEAPPQIVRAIERLNRRDDIDVILLVRGGGSIEDLWCFNDERVARAVYDSRIPIVSGVGHEIDFTIVDFVADLRAPTPSAAAEQSTPHVDGISEAIRQRRQTMRTAMLEVINQRKNDLADMHHMLDLLSPRAHVDNMRQSIDLYEARMKTRIQAMLTLYKERLTSRTSALNNANPNTLLKRGYAYVTDEQGKHVKSISDVTENAQIQVRLSDGILTTRVEDKHNHE